jgi:Predicted double-stranded RNA/RNA-DNA hybrid binding protein
MKKQRFCVVWNGRIPGVYNSYKEALPQIDHFSYPQYKTFDTKEEAIIAFNSHPSLYTKLPCPPSKELDYNSICVDGACTGGFGTIEYQCVDTTTEELLFHYGPYKDGTNNIAEFLAITEALRYCELNGLDKKIYSDSQNAISWAIKRECNTKIKWTENNYYIKILVVEAISYLNTYTEERLKTIILKWNTQEWGEILADFGRK